jgi:hypothetical protein
MGKRSFIGIVVAGIFLLEGCQQTPMAVNPQTPKAGTSGYSQPAPAATPNYGAYIMIATQLLQQILPLLNGGAGVPQPGATPQYPTRSPQYPTLPQGGVQPSVQPSTGGVANRVGGAVNLLSNLVGGQGGTSPRPTSPQPQPVQPSLVNPQTIQQLIGILGGLSGGTQASPSPSATPQSSPSTPLPQPQR